MRVSCEVISINDVKRSKDMARDREGGLECHLVIDTDDWGRQDE